MHVENCEEEHKCDVTNGNNNSTKCESLLCVKELCKAGRPLRRMRWKQQKRRSVCFLPDDGHQETLEVLGNKEPLE